MTTHSVEDRHRQNAGMASSLSGHSSGRRRLNSENSAQSSDSGLGNCKVIINCGNGNVNNPSFANQHSRNIHNDFRIQGRAKDNINGNITTEVLNEDDEGVQSDSTDSNNNEYKLDSVKQLHAQRRQSECQTACEQSSPSPKTRGSPCIHRKSKSLSYDYINENENELPRAKRRRYKSEGNGETAPLLQVRAHCINIDAESSTCKVASDKPDRLTGELDHCKDRRTVSDNCDSDANCLIGARVLVDDQSNVFNDVAETRSAISRSEFCNECSKSVCQSCSTTCESDFKGHDNRSAASESVTLRKEIHTDPANVANIVDDLSNTARDSLTVNYDKRDIHVDQNPDNTPPLMALKEGGNQTDEPIKHGCCMTCSRQYSELYTRIDIVINDYQSQRKRTDEALTSLLDFKRHVRRLVTIVLFLAVTLVSVSVTFILIRSLLGRNDWYNEVFSKNITNKVAGLQEQYVGVSDMVNDLLMKTRPIIQLTNDNRLPVDGGAFCITWSEREELSQGGGLRLSDRRDAVEAVHGGYFSIHTNIFYKTTLRNTTSVKLEYHVDVRRRGGRYETVQSVVRQLVAPPGSLKLELSAQTTARLQAGDQVRVTVGRDQLTYIADFSTAHELSMFEIS